MAFQPGIPQRDYIDGRRRRHVNPVTFYLVGATAQLLSLYFVGDLMAQTLGDGLLEESVVALQAKGIEDPRAWVGERYILLIQNAYTWLGVITFVLPMALTLKLLLPKRINLAEALVYCFYTVAFVMLITALVAPFSIPVSQSAHGIFGMTSYLVYALFSGVGCFGRKPWPIAAGLISMVVGVICFFLALLIGSRIMFNPNLFA